MFPFPPPAWLDRDLRISFHLQPGISPALRLAWCGRGVEQVIATIKKKNSSLTPSPCPCQIPAPSLGFPGAVSALCRRFSLLLVKVGASSCGTHVQPPPLCAPGDAKPVVVPSSELQVSPHTWYLIRQPGQGVESNFCPSAMPSPPCTCSQGDG